MLVSALQQLRSAIIIHTFPSSLTTLPFPPAIPPGHHRAADWALPVLLSNLPERDRPNREERDQPSVFYLIVCN